MYKVIAYFEDLQDKRYAYNVGDEYPRKGLEVTDKRIKELATTQNRQRKPLIKKGGKKIQEAEKG